MNNIIKDVKMDKMQSARLEDLPQPLVGKSGWPWTEQSEPLPDMPRDGAPWPKVSLVTPSYNQGQFIEETIRSVLLQGYPNLEYIVMDGGSSDESVEIIRKYEPWLTCWVSERDSGQADAINKGWQCATGEFLGWINSDDVLVPGGIATTIDYFTRNPEVGYVYGDLEIIDAESNVIGTQTYEDFVLAEIVQQAGWISQPGNLMRRSVFDQVGLLDVSLHFQMDLDYWLRAALICQFGYLRQPLARFRRHADAKTSNKTYLAANDIMTVYRKFFTRTNLPVELRNNQALAWANAHLYAARMLYASDRFADAWADIWQAIQTEPRILQQKSFWNLVPYLFITPLLGGRYTPLAQSVRRIRRHLVNSNFDKNL